MKIMSLSLENFQGIRALSLDFSGNSANVYGENATGKTTIYNAITWLLFGKSSTGAKNFTPKTRIGNEDMHNADHAVEAVFALDDGVIIRLRKVYHEIYRRKRGSAAEEFNGHGTDYFVDGVPHIETEYNKLLERYCGGPTVMMMLTMVNYFPEVMTWSDRRKLLLDVCGDISDDDVMEQDGELYKFAAMLHKPGGAGQLYTVDEYSAIAKRKMTDINNQIQSIPARVDEARRAIPDMSMYAADAHIYDIAKLAQIADHIRQQISDLRTSLNGSDLSISEKQIAERKLDAERKLAVAERAHIAATRDKLSDTMARKSEAERLMYEALSDTRKYSEKVRQLTSDLQRMREKRACLYARYQETFSQDWDGETTCPICKRQFPDEMIIHAHEEFNLHKSKQLEAINQDGQSCSKELIAQREAELLEAQEQLANAQVAADTNKQLAADLQREIDAAPKFETTSAYAQCQKAISDARSAETTLNHAAGTVREETEAKIRDLEGRLRANEERSAKLRLSAQQNERIAELQKQEKQLASEYERLEHDIYLCELFMRTKASMLSDMINSKFRSVRFRLFIEQVNGGLKEDCEVMIPAPGGALVPYATANNAGRINAGLEIIGALSAHFGVSLPIIIDNAESVTHIHADPNMQIIGLVVSAADKSLRLEVAA